MKKVLLMFFVIICFITCGCTKKTDEQVLEKFSKKVENAKSYYLTGVLEMVNNETSYMYDVSVSYTKDNNFKVSLKNQSNDHEQIILRNDEGVYVITPSLNKSFKFQSEWPYNNSQAYLLQTILDDLKTDEDHTYVSEDDKHIFTSKVNYSNNKELVSQKVTMNSDYEVETVEVLDESGNVKIKMSFSDVDYNAKFNTDYYSLEQNVLSEVPSAGEVSTIEDVIYPMYIPVNTTLSSQDKVNTSNGERVILTFEGDSPFTFIQENTSVSSKFTTIPVNGELVMLGESIGVLDESSITWISEGMEYYLVSSTLNDEELLEVARSIGSIPVIK